MVTIAAGVAWSARTPLTAQAAAVPAAPPAVEIAPDTFLLAGAMLPERGPDGNTVVLIGPAGLVVVDTGRHVWHSDGILAFATARRRPIVALVYTHWHLDHASGNRRVKAAFPAAQVHTTTAVPHTQPRRGAARVDGRSDAGAARGTRSVHRHDGRR